MREHTRTRKRASARERERERGGEKIMTTHLDVPLEAVLFRTAVTQPLIEILFEKSVARTACSLALVFFTAITRTELQGTPGAVPRDVRCEAATKVGRGVSSASVLVDADDNSVIGKVHTRIVAHHLRRRRCPESLARLHHIAFARARRAVVSPEALPLYGAAISGRQKSPMCNVRAFGRAFATAVFWKQRIPHHIGHHVHVAAPVPRTIMDVERQVHAVDPRSALVDCEALERRI